MGRMGRGWALSKESWAIVRADRSLLVFPDHRGDRGADRRGGVRRRRRRPLRDERAAGVAIAIIGLYTVIAFSIFCNVALAACAARSLDGEDTRPSEGWAAARARLRPILGWALLQLVVGGLITALQAFLRQGAGQLIGLIVGGLANFAWTVATFFVIPVIAFEELGPKAALGRSVAVLRQRWGEGVAGTFAIGAIVFLVAFLPGAALVALGIVLGGAGGAVLIVLGAAVFLVGAVVQNTLMAVFKVALYRFATEDRVVGRFERSQLEAAFRPRGRMGRAAV